MTIKMRLSKVLFFLCFRPTIKFQGGSSVDPLFEPSANPLLTRPLKNYFFRHSGGSDRSEKKFEITFGIVFEIAGAKLRVQNCEKVPVTNF